MQKAIKISDIGVYANLLTIYQNPFILSAKKINF